MKKKTKLRVIILIYKFFSYKKRLQVKECRKSIITSEIMSFIIFFVLCL